MFGIDDAAAATLASGALGFIGGQLTNDRTEDVAAQNNAWSAAQYATRYQTQVKDLEAAGLNPMLAYGQSPGSAPTAQQVQFQNPVSSASDAMRSTSGAIQSLFSAGQADALTDQAKATAANILEQTKKIPLEMDQIKFVIQKLAEEAANIAQDTQNKTVLRTQMKAMIEQIGSETQLLKNQVAVEAALDNIGRTSKEMKPLVDMLRSFFPTYHFGGRIK